ncbi:1539_t:CDS:2, partial [Racocetra persica]
PKNNYLKPCQDECNNDNSQQDTYNRDILLNESFSKHNEEDNIELHDTDNVEPYDADNIGLHDIDNIKSYNIENTSIENSFRLAKELLEFSKNNKATNLFENRYPLTSNVLQELTIQVSDSSHNQTIPSTFNIQEEKTKHTLLYEFFKGNTFNNL